MSIHIDQVLDYLDYHPVCQYADTMKSLMEMLHDIYVMHNSIDSEKLRSMFSSLHAAVDSLPETDADMLLELVSGLCMEQEQLAFSHGIVVGMQLMTEVNFLR